MTDVLSTVISIGTIAACVVWIVITVASQNSGFSW